MLVSRRDFHQLTLLFLASCLCPALATTSTVFTESLSFPESSAFDDTGWWFAEMEPKQTSTILFPIISKEILP